MVGFPFLMNRGPMLQDYQYFTYEQCSARYLLFGAEAGMFSLPSHNKGQRMTPQISRAIFLLVQMPRSVVHLEFSEIVLVRHEKT